MSQIFTLHDVKKCENCNEKMIELKVSEYVCFNWTQGVSDTQRYKQCGNAVTVNVVEYIAKNFLKD